jgi:HAD superfamily hydrolase (TIGR01490 family)
MRTIACFDFDGTLTRADTLGPFLRVVAGNGPFLRAFAADAPRLALAGAGAGSRDDAKERMLRRLLGGRDHADLVIRGNVYADDVVARRMRVDMVDRLRWHVERGHEVAIVSASLDVYIDGVAEQLGVETVLCSRLEVDDDGRVTGRLVGGNCRGAGKAQRIRERFGADGYELWAYGDSAGDAEMLAAADHPVRLTRRGRIRIPTP